MKRICFALLLTFLLALPSNAQVKFGIQGGFNINKFELDTKVVNANNRAGFYVGPTFYIDLPLFDIEAASIYDVRSIEVDNESVTRQNLDIQANIRKGLNITENIGIFVFAGPQFAFNIGAKNIGEITDCVKDWTWRSSDFSINLGGGVRIKKIEVRVNYNTAIGKTAQAEEEISNAMGDFKNYTLKPKSNAWQIGLAYIF